jgi:hypothetical protein
MLNVSDHLEQQKLSLKLQHRFFCADTLGIKTELQVLIKENERRRINEV